MSYVNCGAYVNGERPKSKKALKDALKDGGTYSVRFDVTSMWDARDQYLPNDIPDGVTLSVCGPDPYNSRKWYASISKTDKGIKVT